MQKSEDITLQVLLQVNLFRLEVPKVEVMQRQEEWFILLLKLRNTLIWT